jgi:hypothetical protein
VLLLLSAGRTRLVRHLGIKLHLQIVYPVVLGRLRYPLFLHHNPVTVIDDLLCWTLLACVPT